uniref:Uncharacterized protein n=1 Tax=Glossina palpalis gambiensis TaxID=67801 RepID=A0A1B0B5J4_9MUSC
MPEGSAALQGNSIVVPINASKLNGSIEMRGIPSIPSTVTVAAIVTTTAAAANPGIAGTYPISSPFALLILSYVHNVFITCYSKPAAPKVMQ